jgi:hypothetical protein
MCFLQYKRPQEHVIRIAATRLWSNVKMKVCQAIVKCNFLSGTDSNKLKTSWDLVLQTKWKSITAVIIDVICFLIGSGYI